jgi:hypothetical protein
MKKPTRHWRQFEWKNFQGTGKPASPEDILGRPGFVGTLRSFFGALLEKATRYQERSLDEELR